MSNELLEAKKLLDDMCEAKDIDESSKILCDYIERENSNQFNMKNEVLKNARKTENYTTFVALCFASGIGIGYLLHLLCSKKQLNNAISKAFCDGFNQAIDIANKN